MSPFPAFTEAQKGRNEVALYLRYTCPGAIFLLLNTGLGGVLQLCFFWSHTICMYRCVQMYTCAQRQGLLCDETVWLSVEQVSLQEKSLKGSQSPVVEHQVEFWQTERRDHKSKDMGVSVGIHKR